MQKGHQARNSSSKKSQTTMEALSTAHATLDEELLTLLPCIRTDDRLDMQQAALVKSEVGSVCTVCNHTPHRCTNVSGTAQELLRRHAACQGRASPCKGKTQQLNVIMIGWMTWTV